MRCSMPLLATVCLLAAIAAPAQAQSNANAEICAADDASAFSPEQRIAACTALIEAAKDKPQDLAAALVNRGAAYWYVNKMKAAFDDLDRAVALDPKNARAFRERSNANRTSGRLDRALSDANTAVRLDPNDPKAFDFRGNVFNNNRQYDRAIEDYNEALRLDPKYAQAFMDRGVANYFKEDYQAAIKDYDESIKLNPKHARAYTNRGAAYKKLGMDEKALADESEAIKLDPTVPEYFDNRGLSYQKNGDYDRAIADYNEAIRIAPKANFLTNRGDSYQFKGELDRAIADYDRALKLNPGFYLAYNNRGAAFRKKGDLDRAIENYEQALRVNPRFDSAAENLAVCPPGTRPPRFGRQQVHAADLRLRHRQARSRKGDLLGPGSDPARSPDRRRLQGRDEQARSCRHRASAARAASVQCDPRQILRSSRLSAQARAGAAADRAARQSRRRLSLSAGALTPPLSPLAATAFADQVELTLHSEEVGRTQRQIHEDADAVRQHAERVGIGQPDLRFVAFDKGRIGHAPMREDRVALPNRMRQQRGPFAHGEDEIEARRIVAGKLIPILRPRAGDIDMRPLQQFGRAPVDLGVSIDARRIGVEFFTAFAIKKRFGHDRTGGIAVAQEKDVVFRAAIIHDGLPLNPLTRRL